MSEELKACPFCGGSAEEDFALGTKRIVCSVNECSARMGWLYDTEAEAIAAWNRRTPSEPVSREVERQIEGSAVHFSSDMGGVYRFYPAELRADGSAHIPATLIFRTPEPVTLSEQEPS